MAQVGYDRFVTPPVTWINDVFDNNPPRIQFGCFTGSSPCVAVNAQFGHVNGVAVQATATNFYNDLEGDARALRGRSTTDTCVKLCALCGGHDRAGREFRLCLRGDEHLEAGGARAVVRNASGTSCHLMPYARTENLTVPISAIVPTRERPEVLGRTLASLRRQGVLPAELIVVDATAGAATRNVVSQFASKARPLGCRVAWQPAAVAGAAAQRNQGVGTLDPAGYWFF